MDGRLAKKHRRTTRDFAFSGLIACHTCGCAVVCEIKKERYVYYHCTGHADKCQGNPATCRRKYVRDVLHASHADLRREHEEAINQRIKLKLGGMSPVEYRTRRPHV